MRLRVVVALCAVIALELAGHYAYGQMRMQATAQRQQREPYDHNDESQSPLHEDRSVHHRDLDNRADILGVEQDILRGATNFTDPGYRDLPNPAQMQFQRPGENDHRTAGIRR